MLEEAKADVLTRHEGTTSMYHCTGMYWPDTKQQLLCTTVQVCVLTRHHCTVMYWPDTKEQLLCTAVQVCTDLIWRNNFYVPLYRYMNWPEMKETTFMYHCKGMCTDLTRSNNFYVPLYRYVLTCYEGTTHTTVQVYVRNHKEVKSARDPIVGPPDRPGNPSPLYSYVLTRHEGACSIYHCTGMYWPDMKEQLICILKYRYMY